VEVVSNLPHPADHGVETAERIQGARELEANSQIVDEQSDRIGVDIRSAAGDRRAQQRVRGTGHPGDRSQETGQYDI
jgi:hypothetical protein